MFLLIAMTNFGVYSLTPAGMGRISTCQEEGHHVSCENAMEALYQGGWVNKAYSRFSTTHGHITDCKFYSVVYAGVYAW